MKWFKLMLIPFVISGSVRSQVVADFSLTNAINGRTVNLRDYNAFAGVALIFVSYDCPFDKYYLARILAIAETFKANFPILLINSNTDEVNTGELLTNHLTRQTISIPYLLDKSKVVQNALNARRTPECVVLKNTGQQFSIVYRGAIDDSPQSAAHVRESYLTDAIENVLAGRHIEVAEHRPPGCLIR